ncbi:MAG: isochorismatase family protein [Candidatus Melainabacteria bacterium]|nr:isochorismatase family protein [Candidatus Melainabacteria bacterium]
MFSTGFWIALVAIAAIVALVALMAATAKPIVRVLRVLIRVDVQNDFCDGGNLAVSGGGLIVGIINKLSRLGKRLGFYDLVVDTQDSHPRDHGSFFDQHPGLAAFTLHVLNGLQQMLWTVHCVVNTRGWQFHGDLDRSAEIVDKTVPKGQDKRVDSYSGFYDNGRDAAEALKAQYPFLGKSTGLAEYIIAEAEKRNADEILIDVVGLAFDYCVAYTAKDARTIVYRGKQIRVRVILDATKAIANKPHEIEAKVKELEALGIEVVMSDDVVNEIHASAFIPYPPMMH